MFTIIPLKGKKVIDPKTTKDLPEKGIIVKTVDRYWKNRETDGDVTVTALKIKEKESK